jgi:hypothetical protein
MDILKMLEELRSERHHIEEAILVMERLVAGRGRRRGRPPAWMSKTTSPDSADSEPKKRSVSAAARKRMAAAQKKRWAAGKAEAKKAAA